MNTTSETAQITSRVCRKRWTRNPVILAAPLPTPPARSLPGRVVHGEVIVLARLPSDLLGDAVDVILVVQRHDRIVGHDGLRRLLQDLRALPAVGLLRGRLD